MKVFYLRDRSGFPVGCVASDLLDGEVKFAVSAWNSTHDKFDRKEGRRTAEERLKNGELLGKFKLSNVGRRNVKKTIMTLVTAYATSHKARKAAQLWLKNFHSDSKNQIHCSRACYFASKGEGA